MEVEVIMPKLGLTMDEGTVVSWHKEKGEKVEKDEILFEIQTDKAIVECESPATGVLTEILVPTNETVSVGTTIAIITEQ